MSEPTPEPEYNQTAADIARMYRCTSRHIMELANKGRIPGLRIGTHWRFDKAEVLAAFKEITAISRRKTSDI